MKNISFLVMILMTVGACRSANDNDSTQGHITLGDSSTIVTETDSIYLKNDYTELTVGQNDATMVDPTITPVDTSVTTISVDTAKPLQAVQSSQYSILLGGKQLTFNETNKSDGKSLGKNIYALSGNKLPKTIGLDPSSKAHKLKYRKNSTIVLHVNGNKIPVSNNFKVKSNWTNASINGNTASINWNAAQAVEPSTRDLQKHLQDAVHNSNLSTKDKNKVRQAIQKIKSINDNSITLHPVSYDLEWSATDSKGKPFVEAFSINTP